MGPGMGGPIEVGRVALSGRDCSESHGLDSKNRKVLVDDTATVVRGCQAATLRSHTKVHRDQSRSRNQRSRLSTRRIDSASCKER